MFKMLKSLVTTKASEINNFSNTFNEMNKSKVIMESVNTKDSEYKRFFEQGIYFLNKFSYNDGTEDDVELLHQGAINFTKAIEIKQSKSEAYFYMAYIFYMMKEFNLALNYIKIASSINPDLEGLSSLRNQISDAQIEFSSQHLINKSRKENLENKIVNITSKNQRTPIRRINFA